MVGSRTGVHCVRQQPGNELVKWVVHSSAKESESDQFVHGLFADSDQNLKLMSNEYCVVVGTLTF